MENLIPEPGQVANNRNLKMFESDKNMLKVIDFLKEAGDIKFKTEAYEIMSVSTSNVYKIKHPEKFPKQTYHFTAEQIRLFCEQFNINSNYIFGFDKNMYRK